MDAAACWAALGHRAGQPWAWAIASCVQEPSGRQVGAPAVV